MRGIVTVGELTLVRNKQLLFCFIRSVENGICILYTDSTKKS